MPKLTVPAPSRGRRPPGSPCLHAPWAKDLILSRGTTVALSAMAQVCSGKSPS